jgi:integrase/recombinase XerD
MQNTQSLIVVQPEPGHPFTPFVTMVIDGLESRNSKVAYAHALTEFLSWYQAEGGNTGLNKATVQRWIARIRTAGFSASTVNLRLAAVRKLAQEAADNDFLPASIAQGIQRVKGVKRSGVRAGNWLTRDQAEQLINAPSRNTLKGKRDRAVLSLLVGCGLRRSELSDLTFGHIQQRDSRWALVDICGKGERIRTVPMPSWAKVAIDEWTVAAGLSSGRVFRPVNKAQRLTKERIRPETILKIVSEYGRQIGVPKLAPHDLRRTYAKLAHRGPCGTRADSVKLGPRDDSHDRAVPRREARLAGCSLRSPRAEAWRLIAATFFSPNQSGKQGSPD